MKKITILLFFFSIYSCSPDGKIGQEEMELDERFRDELTVEEQKFIDRTNVKQSQLLNTFSFYENDSLLAMSLYHVINDTIKHSFWINAKDDPLKMENYSQNASPLIITTYNNLLGEELEKKGATTNKVLAYHNNLHPTNKKATTKIASTDDVRSLGVSDDTYLNLIAQGYNNLGWKQSTSSVNCYSSIGGCRDMPDFLCQADDYGGGYCEQNISGACMKRQYENNKAFVNVFEKNAYYRFRDEFLQQKSFGKKYINYYYALSNHLSDKNYPSMLQLRTAEAMPIVNAKIGLLLNNNTKGNEIVLNAYEYKKLNALLEEFKALSKNTDYQLIINNIQSDLKRISTGSMTKSQFLNSI